MRVAASAAHPCHCTYSSFNDNDHIYMDDVARSREGTLVKVFTTLDARGNSNGVLDRDDFKRVPHVWTHLRSHLDKDANGTIDMGEWSKGLVAMAFTETINFHNGEPVNAAQPIFDSARSGSWKASPQNFYSEIKRGANQMLNALLLQAKSNGGSVATNVGPGAGPHVPNAVHHAVVDGGGAAPEGTYPLAAGVVDQMITAMRKHLKDVQERRCDAFPPSMLGQIVLSNVSQASLKGLAKAVDFPLTEAKLEQAYINQGRSGDDGKDAWSRWVLPLIAKEFNPARTELTMDAFNLQIAEIVLLTNTYQPEAKDFESMDGLFDQLLSHSDLLFARAAAFWWEKVKGN